MIHRLVSLVLLLLVLSEPALAAEALNGRGMGLVWVLPFVGILLSIALGPLVFANIWHHHYGKIAAFWALCTLIPLGLTFGTSSALKVLIGTTLHEYLPFIIVLFALFTIAGGIYVEGDIKGKPTTNVMLLLIGACLASFIGTTGASMVMIRPMIRANDNRRTNVHVVIFFIFLVSNIGGSLTPLGDPPLFVGFLKGVDFFWTTQHLLFETLLVGGLVLAIFYALDVYWYKKDIREHGLKHDPTPVSAISLHGKINIVLILGVIGVILLSASWRPGIVFSIYGVQVELQNLVRDAGLIGLACASIALTSQQCRRANGFSWEPILEVAKLFAAIFICIAPVLAILAAGRDGVMAPLVQAVTFPSGQPNNLAYFWFSGILSGVLDNAPTYLVFFQLAGGNAQELMGYVAGREYMATTLMAISTGAVYMGALTYVGNAPNFMVYAIARDMKVNMPGFFGYMLWSGAVLIPIFVLCSYVFFVL